jgi:hypothetical protein
MSSWRQADRHPDRVEQVRQYLRKVDAWRAMPADIKRRFVEDLLAPLIPTDELLEELTGFRTE